MKTKEEILNNQKYGFNRGQRESALQAMDEYTTQQSIAFCEWKDKNFRHSIGGFVHVMGDLLYKGIFSTSQLYTLFQSIKPVN